jgi:hypothetical protein
MCWVMADAVSQESTVCEPELLTLESPTATSESASGGKSGADSGMAGGLDHSAEREDSDRREVSTEPDGA